MKRGWTVRSLSLSLGLAVFSSTLFVGCGEDMSQNKTVVPEVSPADKAKDSMNQYRAQMKNSKKATKR